MTILQGQYKHQIFCDSGGGETDRTWESSIQSIEYQSFNRNNDFCWDKTERIKRHKKTSATKGGGILGLQLNKLVLYNSYKRSETSWQRNMTSDKGPNLERVPIYGTP